MAVTRSSRKGVTKSDDSSTTNTNKSYNSNNTKTNQDQDNTNSTSKTPAAKAKYVPWDGPLGYFGAIVYSLNTSLPIIPDETSKVKSSWFLAPEQHFIEFTIISLWIGHWFKNFLTNGIDAFVLPEDYEPKPIDNIDIALSVAILLHGIAILTFKLMRDRVWFMLQPCNITTWMLVWMCVSRSEYCVWGFNLYLHTMWGSWLGFVAADLRDYNNKIEICSFFTMHILIIGIPYVWIARGSLPVYDFAIYDSFMLMIILHWWIYLPVSMLSGWHINYMMQPPRQGKFAGRYYRMLMVVFAYCFTVVTRVGMQKWVEICA